MEMTERVLAIVLLDLIGSTAFVQRVGAQRAAEWLQYHDRLTRSLLYKFNGREIDRSDGFMLSFERAIDAMNFALHYQMKVPPKTRLQTRVGVHWCKIVEVIQDDAYVAANAKRVELEGIGKNVAARTMSVCQGGQVLLTAEAFKAIQNRTDSYTPKGTRYACVGLYKFKGVSEPQALYAVGLSIESLQPPPSSEKAKRVGGSKKIKSRLRDKKIKEWISWLLPRLALLSVVYVLCLMWPFLSQESNRDQWGLWFFFWVDWVNAIGRFAKECLVLIINDLGGV
jgi:class 3 adenylate cyclase